MAHKDLHDSPFDESTVAKLQIFEDYAQAWIPTFVMSGANTICIFDFFAGTGYDKNAIPGSPIRILQKIKEQIGNIFQKKIKVKVYLNEWEPKKKEQKKFKDLQQACNNFLGENNDVKRAIELNYYNEDFENLFPKLLPIIKQFPSLVLLDQNGIKFLSEKYFLELEKTKQTDFLYFVSASYFWRFGESQEFKNHLDIDMAIAKKDPYKFIHRNIIEQLRKKLPANSKLKLYPFTLKKGVNIHGIIFGASHPRAVDKFLAIAWKRNETNGEANFDIDEDAKKRQTSLFENKKLTKVEDFKESVRRKILSKEIINNYELLEFVYDEGHIANHAAEVLKEMKRKGEVNYNGVSPLVTYENVYKKNNKIQYGLKK
ncbi:MAG: three-Cys-motif partner protein TcmP [Chitinophagaceae bacterium]